MRVGLLVVLFSFGCLQNLAQRKDTVLLKTVTVYSLPEEKYLTGSTLQSLDSSLKSNDRSRHLGEILSLQLPIYFRTYGNGMLSGISMRGTSPQHTAVLWNGININSFSLGQADFSILPATAFAEVKVNEGAGSARYGSGAFGGSVLLNSTNSNKSVLSFAQDVGSFGRYFSSLNGSWSTGRWSSSTSAYNLTSRNDFPVQSTGQRQQHASFRQSGILQDITYSWSSARSLSIHYWYHNADRDIQPTVDQVNSTDNQQDINNRLSVRYQEHGRLGLLTVNSGYINDQIIYDGSPSTVIRWINGARHEFTFAETFHTQVGAEWNHIIGNIPNYNGGHAQEDRYDFTSSIQKNIGKRLAAVINLRQPVVSGFNAPFLPYLGVEHALLKRRNAELKLRGNISKNYRVPTLNDRYWQNAGDRQLLPETSHAGELSWSWQSKGIEISNTWFSQRVDNWIQWVPDATGNYRPRNIEQVVARGFEMKVSLQQQIGSVMIVPMIAYQFTQSTTTQAPPTEQYTIGKQLIYTPLHTASAYLLLRWKKYSADASAQYGGKRYTDSGNADAYALPAYVLLNFSAGKFWTIDCHRLDLRIAVKNLLNADYQLYAAHAMPGRNYNLQISYQLNSKTN